MATTLNFDLTAFDLSLNLDVSMDMDEQAITYSRDASATVVIQVPVDDLKTTFKFVTDASDVDDLSAADTKYYVDAAAFPKINVAHAMAEDGATPSLTTGQIATGYAAGKNLMKHDFMRYLAEIVQHSSRLGFGI